MKQTLETLIKCLEVLMPEESYDDYDNGYAYGIRASIMILQQHIDYMQEVSDASTSN